MFDTVQPQGPTPIGKRLNVLVNGYLDGLDKAKRSNRQLPKPVNMLVLTDGTPSQSLSMDNALVCVADLIQLYNSG